MTQLETPGLWQRHPSPKIDKLCLIIVITSWSLEFKPTNPNTDIISLFDSCSLVNSGKGCYVWISPAEMKTDILFEPVWH